MKFVYRFPGRSVPMNLSLQSADVLTELAIAAEDAGFDAVAFDEHPAPPESWRRDGYGHDCLDPFVALAAVAAATQRVRLLTNLTVVPYRNPFLLAKTVSTLDVLSKGRVTLGIGTGYLPAEYAALGVDFERRNAIFDESIAVLKQALIGEPVTYRGIGFTADAVTVAPASVQRPHPPLWIGGNSRLSLRRVAEVGQGWLAMPGRGNAMISRRSPALANLSDLDGLITYLRTHAEKIERTAPIDILAHTVIATDPTDTIKSLQQLRALGVTWTSGGGEGTTVAEAKEAILRYRNEVIDKLRD